MRIAILSDVHGNLVALEAVLRDASCRGLEGMLHLGDLVGYGPRPNEVVARVREEGIGGVVGNYDLAVLAPEAEEGRRTHLSPLLSETGRQTYVWTRETVSGETLSFLKTLPAQVRIEEGGREYLCVHGSPESASEYLLPDVPEDRLQAIFTGAAVELLAVGHTHLPGVRHVGPCVLVNPGSVGRPKDGDWRASYMILDTEDGRLRVEHVRVDFDVERVVEESIRFGLPSEQAEALRLGRGV